MPDRPGPPPKPEPPQAQLPYAQNSFTFPATSSRERFQWVMVTPPGYQSVTRWVVDVFDSFVDNRWEEFENNIDTPLVIGPGNQISIERHKYDATCWRFRSEYLTADGWKPGVSYAQSCAR